jgi:type I restriction enzyme S subunit
MPEWRSCTLGDVIELKRGYDLPERDREHGPYPIVSSSGISGWHSKAMAKAPGVVTGRYGTLGVFHYITEDFWPLNTALYVRDFKGNHRRFISYFLRTIDFFAYSDKAAVPGLNRNHLHMAPVTIPDPDTQRAIAAILGSLDDKIEQSRRTARAMERLARALFRAWFVDFEPVKAKAAGAASFPSMPQAVFDALPTTFTDSDLGPVPEGWEVKSATEVAQVAIGKTPPRKEPQWFSTDPTNVPWVSIADMGSSGVFVRGTSEYLTPEAIDRYSVRRIPSGSVLFSFKLTVGRVAIADGEITSNEAIAHFVPTRPDAIGSEYLFCYLAEYDHTQLGSTSSIATATNSKAVKAMPVLVPPENVSSVFTTFARPIFDCLRAALRENDQLGALRDYLLPKLMSGQVPVEVGDA